MRRFSMDWSELSLQVMITFGHFLWQACVVGVVLLVVQHVAESLRDSRSPLRLRRSNVSLGQTDLRGANIRYTIACVAFFSLPIFVIATFVWVHQSRGPIMLVASDLVESPSSLMVSANEAIPSVANSDISVLRPPVTPMNVEVPVTELIEPATLVVEPQTWPVQRIEAFAPYLLLAYIVGVGFMLARFSLSIIGSSRLRQTIQPITDVKLLRTISEQCARVGLKRIPIVALCQRVSVPVVVGIVKPMILLPPALLCGLDPNQIAAILSHEIAHIRRYDLIVNFLQRVVEALLFFHPVTWWISRRVSIERENCCDDVAAACMGRLPYAGALLQMAELCIGNDRRRSAALTTLSASGCNSTDLGYRIRRLIGAEETTRVGFTRRSLSIGLALVSLLTVSLVAWGQSQKSEDKKLEDGASQKTRQAVIQALQNPKIELGSNPIAPVVLPNFPSKLRAIPQQDLVIDSVFNVLIDPPAELDIDERRNALRYLIFASPDRLKTLLIERLTTQKLLFPDTTGIAVPYDEIDALGQIGEAASDAIPVLTTFLNAEDPQVRGTAIEALIRVGPRSPEVMQSIAKSFDDPHKVVRGLAVYQVGRYGKLANPLGPKFTELLNADTNDVQCWAAAALITSEFNPDLGFKKLLESSQIGSIVDRKQALSSLAMLGSRAESVMPQLRTMIDDRNSGLAKEVRETIRRIESNDRIFTHAEEADKQTADRKAAAVKTENPGNVPFPIGLQENKPIDIFGTSDLKDEDVAAFVDKTLTKPYRPNLGRGSWQLGAHEYSIILTLESIPQQQMVADALMKKIEFSFGSEDSHARRLAMDYCAQNFPDRLLPYLVRRLSATDFPEPNLSTSGQAFPSYYELTVLGDLGEQGKAAIPALMKHLSAGDPIAREATIRSLVRVGPSDPEVMQSLSKCFNDSNVRVQGTAVYQAGRYGELAKPLGPKFVELLEAKSKEVQFWAAAALITSKFNPDLGFERLLAGAKSGERKDRRQALTTLAMLGSRSLAITPELRSMLNETDPEVVGEVRETIRRIETNDRIVTHAEEADKRATDLKQTPLKVQELSGEWFAQTNLVGLKCQLKSDPIDKGVRPLDVSIKVELQFDQSEEAISRYAQFHLTQDVDSERNGGRIAMAGRLATSQNGKKVNLVYHYRKEGVQGSQSRTVGKICRSNSGELLLTLFSSDSGIFDLEINDLAPVEKLKLVKRDATVSNNDKQPSEVKPDSNKQSFQLIDGETGNPLQGMKCRAIVAKRNTAPRYQLCTTDEHGVVEVAVAEDESAGIDEVPSGWFSNGFGSVFVVAAAASEQQPQRNIEKQNEEPKVLKLWRGTEVDGRLQWPDKTPAAGVKLTAGVYIYNQSWKEKLGMDLTHYSFDHGDWPNWSRTIVTDDDGKFRVTVPPKDARFWLRIGTTQLGFGPQINVGENEAITQRLATCIPLEIQYGGSSRSNELIVHDIPETDDLLLHAGDLPLETGVIVRGRVVDAEGKGLANVRLTSTGQHGPHSGRSATSGEDGKFEFPAMAAGILTVHPDARLRDVTKPIPEQVISRDVQAVFVDQSFTIPSVLLSHEITVQAVPHTEVTFEWVDRRADKTQPIAFYGAFRVRGYMPDENGKPATYWTSETERVERDGRQWLMVKIPTQLLKPDLMLAADSKVTASYSDSTGVTSGPGIVELGDITATTTRTIFGDEPHEPESTENEQKGQAPTKSESAVRKRVHDLGGTMEVRERNGDAEEVRLNLMSKDKLASDEDLKLFATLKNLTRLEFRADHITSQGLDPISLMTNLENLHLWHGRLSDDDVGKLTSLKQLEWLGMYNCRNVTDRSSQHLLQLPNLHSLNLYGTPITVSFLQAIQGPRIRFLDLRRTGVNAKDLSVIEKFPNLRQINLPDEVTDVDLSHLSGLSELKILTLQDLNISDKGLLHLKALTKVETLYLRNTQITDAGLSHILDMQNLETLDLSGTQISSAGLLPLAALPKLQTLDLKRTQVDDEGLKILSQFPRLQFLDLQDTNATEAAVTALRNARPKLEIQLRN